ncbi:hypothetical protein HMPREF0580_0974 [Mobiluncus mulieris ATCC 35239]|uniref:Uncharacterized protein n=1 Tax=Mobiluncus mulieris ATCC 35239 TaxID=871571 RepID=E0QQ47_9ACTO|nr:hypothetical protein HMPREF0577_0327 [Mobiluncus mulieris ATCC 35243]EFM46427.1 hypothetical protein HMPREF0580_0974 [Mobiluncus mulieris ATCC 35239]
MLWIFGNGNVSVDSKIAPSTVKIKYFYPKTFCRGVFWASLGVLRFMRCHF